MDSYIERYIYEVTRRLPEKERADVGKELRANIDDMLPPEATEAQTAAVLQELGDPATLAEQYRQNPRYLISPAMFDSFLDLCKRILPIVGAVCLCLGFALGWVDALTDGGGMGAVDVFSAVISAAVSMAIQGIFYGLVFITAGCAIADSKEIRKARSSAWTVQSLQKRIPKQRRAIPLSDGIVELFCALILFPLAILVCAGKIPILWNVSAAMGQSAGAVFADTFLRLCIPVLAILAGLLVIKALCKLTYRRWNMAVSFASIASALAWLASTIFLLTRPQILSSAFLDFLRTQTERLGDADLLRFVSTGDFTAIRICLGVAVAMGVALHCFLVLRKLRQNAKASVA